MYSTATYFGNAKVGDEIFTGLSGVPLTWVGVGALKPPTGGSLTLELYSDGVPTGVSCTLQDGESNSETSFVGRNVPIGRYTFVFKSVGTTSRGGYLTVVMQHAS